MQLVYLRYLDYHNKGPPISITALFHRVNVSSITDLGFCDRKEVPCTAHPQDWYFNTKYLAILTYFLSPFGHTDILFFFFTIWPFWHTFSHYLAILKNCLSLFSHILSLTIWPYCLSPFIQSYNNPIIWPSYHNFLTLFVHTTIPFYHYLALLP